jgi:outer membrane protein OmpA-like peptidoglycan-associated protein
MSAQGRAHARSTPTSEVAQLSSTGDMARAGSGRIHERLGNSAMAERLGLRGAAQEAESLRPAQGSSQEEALSTGPVDPRLYRLALPKASRKLEQAMAAFEARMRLVDEAAWVEWHRKDWTYVVQRFLAIDGSETIQAARPKVHATQSRSENRANKRSYARNLEQLLAGDKLFTWDDFMALEDIHVAENSDNGMYYTEAAWGNGTKENRSNSNGGLVFAPGYDSNASIDAQEVLAKLNGDDIPFHEANRPEAMSVAEFSVFAQANCYLTDKKSALAKLRPMAKFLRKNPSRRLRVIGRSNFDLSIMNIPDAGRTMGLARARTIRDLLITLGVAPGQIDVEGKQIPTGVQELGVEFELES